MHCRTLLIQMLTALHTVQFTVFLFNPEMSRKIKK